MLPSEEGKFTTLQRDALHWPNRLKQCAAICNSLNCIGKQQVVGDQADFTAFRACEARFLVPPCVTNMASSWKHSLLYACQHGILILLLSAVLC